MFKFGIITSAVVFPAVPKGKARLRLCVTAAHDKHTLKTVINTFKKVDNIL